MLIAALLILISVTSWYFIETAFANVNCHFTKPNNPGQVANECQQSFSSNFPQRTFDGGPDGMARNLALTRIPLDGLRLSVLLTVH
jgi:hypothetical protein